jgi:hypothetical protein
MEENMKNRVPRYFILVLISSAFMCEPLPAQEKEHAAGWPHVKYAIYFTSHDIDSLLSDATRFSKTMEYFAPIKPVHVYLEGSSRGPTNVALLKTVADRFRKLGMKVSGAMVPVGEHGPSTYNNAKDLAAIEDRMRALAGVFDDVILDDWLFTTATDPKSVEDRGAKTWAEYRTSLLLEQSKKHIIAPAKQVNPGIKITIKYPNWYEGFGEAGYDVFNETRAFDHIAVGIETRNRMSHDQHIPIYSGYIFQKWYRRADPAKWIGSWLDNYDMKGDPQDYNAQVWQAVMAQTPEIILWCGGQLHPTGPSSDVYPFFRDLLPEFDRVAGMLRGASHGVPVYLPFGSTGEYNIFGYLGMAGIPLDPVTKFPMDQSNAIFTLHSLSDPMLADQMLERLRTGKDVFMTWQLWKRLQQTEFKNTLNLLASDGGSVMSDQFRLKTGWFRQELVKADKPFSFPRIETTTWPYVRDVAVIRDDYDFGVLLNVEYLKGRIYILNMPDNSYDLLRLPAPALNTLRRAFAEDLGVALEGPGGVAMYMFGEKQYVLYNMSDEPAAMTLKFARKVAASGWRELAGNRELGVKQDSSFVSFGGPLITSVSLSLKPFEIAVVQEP